MSSSFLSGFLALSLVLTALAFAITSESPLVTLASLAVVLFTLAAVISVLESRRHARASRYSRPRRS